MIKRTIYLFLLHLNLFVLDVEAQTPLIHYRNAFIEIDTMLSNDSSLNFKKAVYLTENAYFENRLDELSFHSAIRAYSSICRGIIQSGELIYSENDKDNASTQCAVFLFITDSTLVTDNDNHRIVERPPFTYNFDDFAGQKNWSNMFVSTMIETNKGNCHSMPYLYKMIMDELGQKSYLALAPNHMYIKVNNKKVGWYNIELTCADFPTDAWLMASGYVHINAIRNGIYMKALTEKESVALTLVDLAQGYQAKFGMQDGSFMLECCDTALKYFPNYINALLLKAEIMTAQYKQSPDAEHMIEMTSLYTQIHELGYRKMPNEMYMNWLKSLSGENTEQRMKAVVIRR